MIEPNPIIEPLKSCASHPDICDVWATRNPVARSASEGKSLPGEFDLGGTPGAQRRAWSVAVNSHSCGPKRQRGEVVECFFRSFGALSPRPSLADARSGSCHPRSLSAATGAASQEPALRKTRSCQPRHPVMPAIQATSRPDEWHIVPIWSCARLQFAHRPGGSFRSIIRLPPESTCGRGTVGNSLRSGSEPTPSVSAPSVSSSSSVPANFTPARLIRCSSR